MRKTILILSLLILASAIAAYLSFARFSQAVEPQVRSQLVLASQPTLENGENYDFRPATDPARLSFPLDNGPHPDFQTEWWYYTGNLDTANGRHFGYQLTFFRRAIIPPSDRQKRVSDWSTDQVYLAHFTLTDVYSKHFQAYERYARGTAGLAGVQASTFGIWLYDWSILESGQNTYQIHASYNDVTLDLQLTDLKGPILQGENGYSQKGPQPGNASY